MRSSTRSSADEQQESFWPKIMHYPLQGENVEKCYMWFIMDRHGSVWEDFVINGEGDTEKDNKTNQNRNIRQSCNGWAISGPLRALKGPIKDYTFFPNGTTAVDFKPKSRRI